MELISEVLEDHAAAGHVKRGLQEGGSQKRSQSEGRLASAAHDFHSFLLRLSNC